MRARRLRLALASLFVLAALGFSAFKLTEFLGDPLRGAFHSDDLEVVQTMPPLSDSIFTAMKKRTQSAIEKKSYKKATSMIVAMTSWREMTPQQRVSLKNSVQNLKVALGTAALEGDTNAVAALEFFKNHSVLAR